MKLQMLLQTAAGIQISVAMLNFFLVRILGFKTHLERAPLLLREIFYVHAWFISATLLIFGLLTWRFAAEMGGAGPQIAPIHPDKVEVCRWVAACIGFFWALRTVLQVTYYSSSHWRGRTGRTVIHCVLLLIYGSFTWIYLTAAFG
ncbi:MAG TPA: hypothetical protein VN578_23495 [Candidatus Binatia bacterium]|jgi:hypothetical protein|nr:hypothetical protein [Candidatus Binatia bacterium]